MARPIMASRGALQSACRSRREVVESAGVFDATKTELSSSCTHASSSRPSSVICAASFCNLQNSHLRQVFTTIHEKVLSSKVSKLHTSIGSGEVKGPHPWLSSLSSNRLMQHMNTHSESSSSEAKRPMDERRRSLNRILYRSRQRGHLELDLILGKWTEENIEKLDDNKLKSLIEMLDLENPELWKWLTGQEVTPEHLTENPVFMEIHENIMGALKTHSPSETRAKLGQPWVRGWDDNRKVGGPQVGNQ